MGKLPQLQRLCKTASLAQVQEHYYAGFIDDTVYEAYCHLWRVSAPRFSILCESFENLDDLAEDSRGLIQQYWEDIARE